MRLGLAQKLVLLLTIIVVAIGVVAGTVSVRAQERYLLRAIVLGADQLSKSITSSTWHAMLADNRQTAYEVMRTIAHKQGIERIRMLNREGRVMFTTRPGEPDRTPSAPQSPIGSASLVSVFRSDGGARQLAMVTPIYNEKACSQAACHAHPANVSVLGVLDLRLSLDEVDRELNSAKVRILIVFGSQVILISALLFVFMRHFLERPIHHLIAATRRVSEMNLDEPIESARSGDELGELARSFDTMRVRLRAALAEINEFTQRLESKVEQRTEQLKTAHQRLVRSDRLASLGQLAASVAHEINNPVNGVLNLSMLMQRILKDDGIPAGRIDEFRKYLSQVASETTRVGRIVSDLLSFSRQSKPQRSEADLNQIVNSTVSLISHKLKLSNVGLVLLLDENLPPLLCDASQIQQVVLNLVLNGAEASHGKAGRRVQVRTRHDAEPRSLVLSVSDNGEGIPEANLPKIFDPFFTTKPEGKGVGLGLAVVYGIVQAHGGDVTISTRMGEGTTMNVILPLAPEAGRNAAAGGTA